MGEKYRQGSGLRDFNRMNMTEEQKQQMREQMKIPCEDKQENDECTIKTPMGERTGKCIMQEERLICMGERPMPGEMPRGEISE